MAKLLDADLLGKVHTAAVTAGLDRHALTKPLPRSLVQSFRIAPDPKTGIWEDLHELNEIELLDGTCPLATWLETAHHLAKPRAQAAVFEEALGALPAAARDSPRENEPARSGKVSESARVPFEPTPAAPRGAQAVPPQESPPDPPSDPFFDDARRADLAELRARLEANLRSAPALVAALVKCPLCAGAPATPERVTQKLLDCTGLQVALAILGVAASPGLKDAARDLLWILLPLAADWEDLLRQDRVSTANADLELHLRSETIAEIVIARVEARPCLFSPGTGYPEGALHIPYPSFGSVPVLDETGEGVAKAVVHNLWRERGPDEHLPGRARWDDVKRGVRNEREFFTQAAAEIEMESLQGRRPYLLFVDALLDGHVADLEAWWRTCRKELHRALPGLRLVRLETRDLPRREAMLRTVVRNAVKLP